MSVAEDYKYMLEACAQARKSIPVDTAYSVGCVIVKDGSVISTGFSRELEGNTHAEECALKKLEQQGKLGDAAGCTMYTTMEPCSKRLSGNKPCVLHVINAGVKRVVIGVMEPDTFVKCKGVALLRVAGVEVQLLSGLEKECLQPNMHIDGVRKQLEQMSADEERWNEVCR
eukprot:comp10767_c0_seq1/m.5404 comp10767_c0_seq1/g.5404  ORF comp10767_c0_seq1/g.5404 comp10767_c0_seq1/m.5404 type:complete len:171 (-) comp10767_c0_seq1:20-532(-)